ncbi:GNAT family N-acetyltransferase [Acinetobacter puyangensis]|uniref:GNAT family N-acetyltransferase n=1 Tax=Acinetobacter puyangensis TaxID=1096779 RepID=UPI003A4DAED1
MQIRAGRLEDCPEIVKLLAELGYPATDHFIYGKLNLILASPNHYCFLAVDDCQLVVGFISISIILQIALAGDFARIDYLVVSEQCQQQGIGHMLEQKCVEIAKLRGCDRIELHCHERRQLAHQFYNQQGYIESPKYFMKKL